MKRQRQLLSDTFKAKKPRLPLGLEPLEHEGPKAVESALQHLASLFPRKLFEDSLPPLILKHQIYSIVKDRTTVDRQLSQLKDEGQIRIFQHGFDADTFVVTFTENYKDKVLEFVSGKEFARTVKKFLDSVLSSCPDISYDKKRMLGEFGFTDTEITQLVNAGVLTVRDAGSWWLAVPGAGRFIKYFLKGRKAVLGMIQKAKYKEVLLSDLQNRRAPSAVKLGIPYHIHDIIGAQLVDWYGISPDLSFPWWHLSKQLGMLDLCFIGYNPAKETQVERAMGMGYAGCQKE
nr:serine/threonine-protein kinase 19 isoform X2 [Pogona vitticeps]XP_020666836.1 serine/threonine-protein kinase 19 isoform X2 [Pogona vitticeps]XP_020666837.1 serine/threonine-protein kinase 19 isoform X2 [Pogona vitticeps]XP_020666838.1 serine/threonine-protein kinase 19 isoform X2 [Pogona vitticeps]